MSTENRVSYSKVAARQQIPLYLKIVFVLFPMVLGIIALAEWIQMRGTFELPGYPNLITKAVPYFLLLIALEITFFRKNYRTNDTINSLSMGVFAELVQKIFLKGLNIVPYYLLHQKYALIRWDEREITWLAWWLMFAGVDLGYYWMHRAHHEFNVLWTGHNVHHSSNNYNLSTALRQSPVQTLFSWVFYLPMAFFFPPNLFVFHNHVNTIYQFWIHTEAVPKLGPVIEFVFNTPSHHRVHHGRSRGKTFGGTLILFDRLFGTFQEEKVGQEFFGINHSLDTWNVLYVQFHHLIETFRVMRITPLWSHKIRVWLDLGPSYNWLMLSFDAKENNIVTESYTSQNIYDARPKNAVMTGYVIVHFLISTVLTVIFLFTPYSFDLNYALFGLTSLAQSMVLNQLLYDTSLQSFTLEVLRLGSLVRFLQFLHLHDPIYYVAVGILCLSSVVCLVKYQL
jgi:alkylglycerol monooxygenase